MLPALCGGEVKCLWARMVGDTVKKTSVIQKFYVCVYRVERDNRYFEKSRLTEVKGRAFSPGRTQQDTTTAPTFS